MVSPSKGDDFSLDDFKIQLEKIANPGLMQKLIEHMPGMWQISEMLRSADTIRDSRRVIGIINAMTMAERRTPRMIEPSRRERIANGAGVQSQEVHALVKQFEMMKPLVRDIAGRLDMP